MIIHLFILQKGYYKRLEKVFDKFLSTTDLEVKVTGKFKGETPGLGCLKITTLIVNLSLKFQMLISQIHQYFLLKNGASLVFSTKNISVFGYKAIKHSMG